MQESFIYLLYLFLVVVFLDFVLCVGPGLGYGTVMRVVEFSIGCELFLHFFKFYRSNTGHYANGSIPDFRRLALSSDRITKLMEQNSLSFSLQ